MNVLNETSSVVENVPTILAVIAGQPLTEYPVDLFIPPDALRILLDSFSGPLDLLCYLIRRQDLDVMNIPIALITKQYLEYIQLMEVHRLELAAEYLVMAAMLAEIKSRLLLPRPPEAQDDEEDPRLVLVRKLQAYEAMRVAVQMLDELPRFDREHFRCQLMSTPIEVSRCDPDVNLSDLYDKMLTILQRQDLVEHHHITQALLSVRDRMASILNLVNDRHQVLFHQTLSFDEGRGGVIVSFLAILELAKQSLLQIIQTTAFSPIYLLAIEND